MFISPGPLSLTNCRVMDIHASAWRTAYHVKYNQLPYPYLCYLENTGFTHTAYSIVQTEFNINGKRNIVRILKASFWT